MSVIAVINGPLMSGNLFCLEVCYSTIFKYIHQLLLNIVWIFESLLFPFDLIDY